MSAAQTLMGEPPGRIAPARELVNTFEFEAMAQRSLSAAAFAEIAGSDRSAFERITFRPRMMVNTTQLDLTTELFGQRLFAPILVGPASGQKRFHAEGELASVRGASAAKTAMVVSGRASYPIDEIAAQPATTLWYQVYPEPDTDAQRRRIDRAVGLGCKALCITIGGADILKALALGARAVMLGRPALWALAAYGSAGVQAVLELLQTELARDMAMCGKPNLKSLDPGLVKIHARRPTA